VIVLGGLGLFGRTAAEQLRQFDIRPQIATRRSTADMQVEANDRASIRASFRAGDIVLDAAGPFYHRTTALVEAAIETGFDIIDINDDLSYAERALALEPRIASAEIRVLSSASSVSAVAAAVVRHSRVTAPVRVTAFLAPATRHTANAGAALSLIGSVGRPIMIYRNGRWQSRPGWSEDRRFAMPPPIGKMCGRLIETADAVWLPRIWPTLSDVAMYVDANVAGGNMLLRLATRSTAIRRLLERHIDVGAWVARWLGSSAGGIAYEIEDASGRIVRWAIASADYSHVVAVAPAVLAVRAIVENRFADRGLIPPDRHVEPEELFVFLKSADVHLSEVS
jgi:hypothetical protein